MPLLDEARAAELRSKAEAELASRPAPLSSNGRDAERLLHELQVHQIELEMQNEVLQQANGDLTASYERYLDIYDYAPVGYLTITGEGLVTNINRAGAEILGDTTLGILGQTFARFLAPEDAEVWQLGFNSALQETEMRHVELALLRRGEGEERRFVHLGIRHLTKGNPSSSVLVALTDITARKSTEARLHESEARMRAFFDVIPVGAFISDRQGQLIYVNPTLPRILGYASSKEMIEIVNRTSTAEAVYAEPSQRRAVIEEVDASASPLTDVETRFRRKDGRIIEVNLFVGQQSNSSAADGIFYGIVIDITERKQAEAKLRLGASVFSHAQEGITITDSAGTIIEVNDTFSRITGYSREEAIGQNPRILASGRHDGDFYAAMWRALAERDHWSGDIWNRNKSGELYVELLNISTVRDKKGVIRNYVALFSDITALRENQGRLEHRAHYDALTNLPNRILLADRLQQTMAQALRREQHVAVCYLDLDGFKTINDCHGHEPGDQLLIAVATRMKESLREGDTLARLGGDEFVAVLNDLPDIESSMPMLTRLLDAASQPVQVGELTLQVSVSIGVTFYPQPDLDAAELLRQADQAMYAAKSAGKNRYCIFDAGQD